MSNQIKLTIDVSDQLLDKLLTVMAVTSQQNALQGCYATYGSGWCYPQTERKHQREATYWQGRQDNGEEEKE